MLKNITYIFTIFFLFFTAEVISQPSITWNKVYNRHQSELAKDICKAETGNYFITGHTQGFLYVMKINDYGDTLWTKEYPKYDDINDACVSSGDGGCVIAGYGYIVKINSLGNIEWDIDTLTSRLYDIIKTNDNGYIACGNTIFSGYIIKINSNGQPEWSNNYTSGYSRNYRNITIANNGGYLAVGSSKENASADTTKALITKINDTGGIIWEKKHLIQNRYGNISSIVSDDNGYTVIGETDDSLQIINIFANVFYSKIDNNGNLIHTKIYNSIRSEYAGCLKKKNNNSYVLTFLSLSVNKDSTFAKMYIIDSSGVIKNQNQVASADYTEFNSAQLVENGDIIFAGYSDFIKMGGNNDIHLIRTDSTLSFPQNIFGIEPINNTIPIKFTLHQNYPNPFNPITKIKFEIPYIGFVKLIIYDVLGKIVGSFIDEKIKAGIYEIIFNGSSLSSGIYFYRLNYNESKLTKKMLLVK